MRRILLIMSSIIVSFLTVDPTRAFLLISRSIKTGTKAPGNVGYSTRKSRLRDKDGFLLNAVSERGSNRRKDVSFPSIKPSSSPHSSSSSSSSPKPLSSRLTKSATKESSTFLSSRSNKRTSASTDINEKESRVAVPRRFLQTEISSDEGKKAQLNSMRPKTAVREPRPGPIESSSLKRVTVSRISADFGVPRVAAEISSSDRPFTLPTGQFKPKQSLGQNFLSDQNYVLKIVNALNDDSEKGCRVVELGPGPGALSRMLVQRYPNMTAVEIDQRAVAFLTEKLPSLKVIHMDVLKCDWAKMADERGGRLSIIGNLPFYITSQILFSLADSWKAIDKAVVTMQYEVAERMVAKTGTKQYGILSVVFQLYGNPQLNFKIPPTVFFPQPKVDSALVTVQFQEPHPALKSVNGDQLRKVITAAFRQRRKMLRQSLKELLKGHPIQLPDKWATLRPEALKPVDFVFLTRDLFGEVTPSEHSASDDRSLGAAYRSDPIWRKALDLSSIGVKNVSEEDADEDDEDDSDE